MAPVLLDSPVVLHLCYPELFPNEVLKIHAEHLGHFLSLQSVPKINEEIETVLYKGLCHTFTEQAVRHVYGEYVAGRPDGYIPNVFVSISNKTGVKDVLALIRKILALFDKNVLCNEEIPYNEDTESPHMIFMCLVQLFVVFLSIAMTEQDLATAVGVASSVFLELNHGHPLSAAAILKPMFVPYFEQQRVYAAGKTTSARREQKTVYYKLFQGYRLTKEGVDTQIAAEDISWTDHSISARFQQGCALEERAKRVLWFAAPQYGDRLALIKENGGCLTLMGGQTDDRAKKIAALLVSDPVMGYVQSAVFGTFRNMLPCHNNSDLNEAVMDRLQGSMGQFAMKALRQQSSLLWNGVKDLTNTCLSVKGVGFIGQDKGTTLNFGRVYTGSDEKKLTSKCTYGTFTSVALAMTMNTLTSASLDIALYDHNSKKTPPRCNIHNIQSTPYKPSRDAFSIMSDIVLYTRYNNRLNGGEFTEVANVKSFNDDRYNSAVHTDNLTVDSKYQLTTSHGALPMCVLTTIMTVRQTIIMLMGYMCAELARAAYVNKATNNALCKHLTGLILHGKFRDLPDAESVDTMKARYGELLKVTGPVFSASERASNLDSMEWFNPSNPRLPEYIRTSLNMIGGTREAVERIIRDKRKSYNRVILLNGFSDNTLLRMSTMYENKKYMIHAPLLMLVNLALFSNQLSSRSLCKLSKRGSYYIVRVLPNRCIDLSYMDKYGDDISTRSANVTVTRVFEKITEEVSCILPRIDASRMRMLTPNMTQEDFMKLVDMVREANIEIVGDVEQSNTTDNDENVSSPRKRVREAKSENDDTDDEQPTQKSVRKTNVYGDVAGAANGERSDANNLVSLSIFDTEECDDY